MVLTILINALSVVIWLLILIRLDDNKEDKKSTPIIIKFYFYGLLSIVVASFLYWLTGFASSIFFIDNCYIDSFILDFLFVGPIEEFSKFIIFFLFSIREKSIKEPRDGMLQAASVALAFASVENLFYSWDYGITVLLVRSALTVTGHIIYSSIWGFAYSTVVYERICNRGRLSYEIIFGSLLPAAFLHGLYDFFIDIGLFVSAVILNITVLAISLIIYRVLVKNSPFTKFPLREYRKAIPILKLGLKSHPESFVLNNRIALFYLYTGLYTEALYHLEKCVAVQPHNPFIKCYLGVTLFILGDDDKGKKLLDEGLSRIYGERRSYLKKRIKDAVIDRRLQTQVLAIIKEEPDRLSITEYRRKGKMALS
ncbi:MAG: hypothetical protein DRP87_11710 [Spirochaetes bacterium]|nr:MAG: hypothetical protein DRP87_11710 [Spirochaetota bacterium]